MTCPFMNKRNEIICNENGVEDDKDDPAYTDYLKLNTLLGSVQPVTNVHDEHLFIVIHQTYELWFKQIIHEIDSVREIFLQPKVNETSMLTINSRLGRVTQILAILVDQIKILETMTPMDFADFRGALGSSSGFQSWQFRILENKLGVKKENRISYNKSHYMNVFDEELFDLVERSEEEPSVFDLVEQWLERTPGKNTDNFNFFKQLRISCKKWFLEEQLKVNNETCKNKKENMQSSLTRLRENFDEIFDNQIYEKLRMRGDRRMSWEALQGALMIYFYRNEVIFHEPFQMINLLMDIDSLIMKWRSNHVLLVQRQIGSKAGTGGSSGYRYLRATVSDRYKAFCDFFHLTNYLVPRKYIPSMDLDCRKRLGSITLFDLDQPLDH